MATRDLKLQLESMKLLGLKMALVGIVVLIKVTETRTSPLARFQTPEGWNTEGQYRALGYMRPLAIWAMQWALNPPKIPKQEMKPTLEADNGPGKYACFQTVARLLKLPKEKDARSVFQVTGDFFVLKSTDSEAGFRCLENEVEILENLDSPHIVKFIGKDLSFEANGKRKLSLFLEYMTGGSLADVAEKFGGSLDEEVICLYTKGILQGLKYLHENGIVHCDLKCKNILLGTSGEIKLYLDVQRE
ncbi:hypothetical protein HAX54_020403 [Datura stramonium]|uniref:Protein kinase domain-containing protein n=1 Tax=Datura stramonium TaxID=4076 RepID=A0ABS8UTB1_DATST|nr:hypothetical protein [Datura stramonium]